jgi:hypothetical protein
MERDEQARKGAGDGTLGRQTRQMHLIGVRARFPSRFLGGWLAPRHRKPETTYE